MHVIRDLKHFNLNKYENWKIFAFKSWFKFKNSMNYLRKNTIESMRQHGDALRSITSLRDRNRLANECQSPLLMLRKYWTHPTSYLILLLLDQLCWDLFLHKLKHTQNQLFQNIPSWACLGLFLRKFGANKTLFFNNVRVFNLIDSRSLTLRVWFTWTIFRIKYIKYIHVESFRSKKTNWIIRVKIRNKINWKMKHLCGLRV